MTSSIGQSIEILCSEQGLDRDMVIEAMKDAVKAAARKHFKTQDKTGDSIQVEWNNDEGMIEISVQKTVVEEVENPSAELSLVEAQELAGDEIELGDAAAFRFNARKWAASRRKPLSRFSCRRCARRSARKSMTSTSTARAN